MLNLKTKLTTGLATAGIMAAAFAPSAMAQDVSVVNNGAFSDNTVIMSDSTYVGVNQTNNTTANTTVHASANTGGNESSFNVGGGSTIDTGNAVNNVAVSVTGGSNTATLPEDCLCPEEEGGAIEIRRNGAFSDNKVVSKSSKKLKVNQTTNTNANTGVSVKANSGKNKSKFNVGGTSDVTSGRARNTVGVVVASGDNTLE